VADVELTGIFMTSGVNDAGEGFVTVAAHGAGGVVLLGQLDPAAVRQHALAYLESAEAAEQDAAVLRCTRKLDLPDNLAGAIIHELRSSRGGDDAHGCIT
jgi:hypothetical protein